MYITIDKFAGPLDLLLHLVKKSNVDICDIDVVVIANQYLEYIKSMNELNIVVASSYLVMAADLIQIKSSSLLPNNSIIEDDEVVESPRDNLIKKLEDYKKYKDVIPYLKDKELQRKDIFIMPRIPVAVENTKYNDNQDISDLIFAFNSFLDKQKYIKPLATTVTVKELSVKERCSSLKKLLLQKRQVVFTSLFDNASKSYIIVTFLAVLELVRSGNIIIKQDNNFSDITVMLRGESSV
ncbi:MAG: segregation/condensation protein A [bacterium]|nr:segregation/condensation protein A [bacterium]